MPSHIILIKYLTNCVNFILSEKKAFINRNRSAQFLSVRKHQKAVRRRWYAWTAGICKGVRNS